ncbi:hypothetical protein CYJ37_08475 [Bacillus sp. UMB0728]|nr:hypothetical protein CYJ37_08475 [Bacillus sp. UMB0728]
MYEMWERVPWVGHGVRFLGPFPWESHGDRSSVHFHKALLVELGGQVSFAMERERQKGIKTRIMLASGA